MKRLMAMGGLAVVPLLANVPAAGAVTIGQTPGATPPALCSAGPFDILSPAVNSGNLYVVPIVGGVANWTLTSWSHFAAAGSGQMLTMKVFRKVGQPDTYQVVGHDGPRSLAPASLNTFSASLAVKVDDVIGDNDVNASTVNNACLFTAAGEANRNRQRAGDLPDGQSGDFFTSTSTRPNVSAELVPTNTFTVGAVTRNKKSGTAKVAITPQNPGEATTSGSGVKVARAHNSAVTVPGAGVTVQVPIRATGKKKKKLRSKGKVNLSPTITFTPTGGTANSRTLSVKLKKKLKK